MAEFEGLGELEIIRLLNKKKKRYSAIFLAELEELLEKDSEQFKKIRKLFLDTINDYTRGTFTVFGLEVEGLENK